MVHVDVKLGAPLLELALLGRHDWDEIMVKTTLLIGLEDEAALLRDERLVGHVGYPGHVTQTAAIVTSTSSHSQVEICKSQSQHVSCKVARGSM